MGSEFDLEWEMFSNSPAREEEMLNIFRLCELQPRLLRRPLLPGDGALLPGRDTDPREP